MTRQGVIETRKLAVVGKVLKFSDKSGNQKMLEQVTFIFNRSTHPNYLPIFAVECGLRRFREPNQDLIEGLHFDSSPGDNRTMTCGISGYCPDRR
jgi:hypothetical protein